MAIQFKIATIDNVDSYTSNGTTASYRFEPENNNKLTDTQGFLRKKQIGEQRTKMSVNTVVTRSLFENTLSAILVYPSDVNVTTDRRIPTLEATIGRFTFENLDIVQEFDDGAIYEIDMKFTEILSF